MTFYYKDTTGLKAGSKDDFFALTGAEWLDEMKVSPSDTPQTTTSICSAEASYMRFLLPLYKAHKKKPSKLFILKGASIGSHSVHALEPIAKGTVISEYLGVWPASKTTSSGYRWGSIDAKEFRNYSALVEDGFPNSAAFHLHNVDSIPLRIVFIALEDILAGEMITINYGMNHTVKSHYHAEYKLESMRQFFTKNSLEQCTARIKALCKLPASTLEYKLILELENLTTKIRYLFQTPSALFHLLYDKCISVESAFRLFDQIDLRYRLLGFSFYPTAREQEIINALALIKKLFTPPVTSPDCVSKVDITLISRVRQRIFFTIYLKGLLQDSSSHPHKEKALMYNQVFDKIYRNDKAAVEYLLSCISTADKPSLLQEALIYAKEVNSTLVAWLQHLSDPLLPLAPVG